MDKTTQQEQATEPTPITSVVPSKSKRNPVFIGAYCAAAILVVAAAGGVYAFIVKNKEPQTSATTTSTSPSAPTTVKTASPTPSLPKISVLEEGSIILTGGYADPTLAKTATGYRLYVNRQSGGPSGYMSYTSTDGKVWTNEKDSIISGAATGRAVAVDGGIRFYYPGAQPINPSDLPANLFSTFSKDGLSFTKDAGTRLEPRDGYYLEGPTVFQLTDGTWRLYFNENTVASGNQRDGEIWGASSPDGLTWTRDAAATITDDSPSSMTNAWKQVLHPFVIKTPKGGYLMFYNTHSEVYAASSEDGTAWTKLGKIGVHGADVDGYFQEDGSFRIFYGDFSEATQGVIYSGVLQIN